MDKSILMESLDFIASEVPRIAKLATQEERAAIVTWLRNEAFLSMYEVKPDDVADAIERGEHCREEQE